MNEYSSADEWQARSGVASAKLMTMMQKLHKGSPSEVLKVHWEDLVKAANAGDAKSRWWLKGGTVLQDTAPGKKTSSAVAKAAAADRKLMEIARKQGMNTDVRRAIFVTMMRSEDFMDCFEQLTKLSLKGKQDREIVHVLLHCCTRVWPPSFTLPLSLSLLFLSSLASFSFSSSPPRRFSISLSLSLSN